MLTAGDRNLPPFNHNPLKAFKCESAFIQCKTVWLVIEISFGLITGRKESSGIKCVPTFKKSQQKCNFPETVSL